MRTRHWAVAAGIFLWSVLPAALRGASPTESDVKAAYLFNFAKFVAWPDTVGNRDAFVLGVLGDDSLVDQLHQMFAGKTVQDKPLDIRRVDTLKDATQCHMLFIGADELSKARAIVASLAAQPVLTVADNPAFAKRGGMVAFLRVDQNIRFNINVRAAESAHLKISSDLLKVANSIEETSGSI